MVYHIAQYSSVGAYEGGLHMNRSTTNGLRSIIARWSWYMSMTLFLVMPVGSGVIVVKTTVFGILSFLVQMDLVVFRLMFRGIACENVQCLRACEKLEKKKELVWTVEQRSKMYLFRRPQKAQPEFADALLHVSGVR